MTAEHARSFPSECRQFVAALTDHLDRDQTPEHARSCAPCARALHAARRQTQWLTELPAVDVPTGLAEGLADLYSRVADAAGSAAVPSRVTSSRVTPTIEQALRDAFVPTAAPGSVSDGLDDLHDRLLEAAESEHGDLLRDALAPASPREDAVWAEDAAQPHVVESLSHLPSARAPGWMWRRIRGELAEPVAPRRRSLVRIGLVAAAFLIGAVFLFPAIDGTSTIGGTRGIDDIVWDVKSEPIAPSLSLQGVLELGR